MRGFIGATSSGRMFAGITRPVQVGGCLGCGMGIVGLVILALGFAALVASV